MAGRNCQNSGIYLLSLENIMSFLESNKKILLSQYPGLWEDLSCPEEIGQNDNGFSSEDVKIEASAAGEPALCIKGIHIHSPRDPFREGQRLAEAVGSEKGPVVILGFGLGYSAQAAAGLGRPVVIVEKHKSLFLKALELRDFSEFLCGSQIVFIIGGAGEGITDALSIADSLISKTTNGKNEKKHQPSIIRNRALIGLDEQWYKSIEDRIRAWAMKDDVNTATHKRFGRRWIRNLMRNMSAIRDYPGVSRLYDLAAENANGESIPVFLAAAGPSLDKIKPLLSDIYNRCIIVAVDTNLRFFVKNGIQPDFILVVDPQFWNSRHLDRCVNEQTSLNTALIAESAVYPPVLNLPFKNKFLCGSLFPLGTFMEKRVDPKGRLGAGGSVATTAWDFARTLGGQEIWTAGLDLAFPELKTHFRGARFEEKSNAESGRFNPVEKWIVRALRDGFPFKARCANGGQVLTDRRLSLYAAWFENQFRQNTQVQNYCLFQDGLAINGFQAKEIEKFLSLPQRRDEINRRKNTAFLKIETEFNAEQEKRERHERYENAVSVLEQGLKSIRAAAEEGMEISRRALRYPLNPPQQEKTLKKLDDVMKRITDSEVKEIAGFLIPAAIEGENEDSSAENSPDPFQVYLKTSIKLFSAILEASF